jgi:hypothetical protein
LMAQKALRQSHDDGLKKDYVAAGERVAEAIVWLRQAKVAFVEQAWAETDQK